MRRSEAAEEAILLASPPGDVRQYIIKRAEAANYFDPISREAEAQLLGRNDRLLDLTLAEYCLRAETAQALLARDAGDWPIRSLVLSNRALGKAQMMRRFPACLFETDDGLLSYLATISVGELGELFRNPNLDDAFLHEFLSLGRSWQAMNDRERLWALNYLAANEKLQRKLSSGDFDDGWDWYMAGKPFQAAWSLIERLEPNTETARHLAALLRNLPIDIPETKGIADAVSRWRATGSDRDEEAKANDKGRLSNFQQVRQSGARLLASRHDAEPQLYWDNDDVALRCGAYEACRKVDKASMEAAVERDGDLAREHLIRNENLWRHDRSRFLLNSVALKGAETEEPLWAYKERSRRFRAEFPSWFQDEEYSEPDERPITEISMSDLIAGLAQDSALASLAPRLAAVERIQQGLIWMVGITLIVLLFHSWR